MAHNRRTIAEKSVTQIAKAQGLSRAAVYARIKAGWTDEQIMAGSRPRRGGAGHDPRLLTHHGETLTPGEWAKKLRIPEGRIWWRLYAGLPTEEVLSTARLTPGPPIALVRRPPRVRIDAVSEQQLARWKRSAKRRGLTIAAWVRASLDAAASSDGVA